MIQKLKRKLAMYKFRRQVRRCANHASDDVIVSTRLIHRIHIHCLIAIRSVLSRRCLFKFLFAMQILILG